jgi:hypothetical protein
MPKKIAAFGRLLRRSRILFVKKESPEKRNASETVSETDENLSEILSEMGENLSKTVCKIEEN